MQTETLSLRITGAESRALRERAEREGVSQGSIVRRALRAYGVVPVPEQPQSLYDGIKHLIGCNKGGPADLSTNPEYFKDFGL
jgi:hypothetical protein